MSHYSTGAKDVPVTLITDGQWHHLRLMREDDIDLDEFVVTVQDGWIVALAPNEVGHYLMQYQLNGQQGEHDAQGNLLKNAQKQPIGLLGTDIELMVTRWPLATSDQGGTARASIRTDRRLPKDFWADTKHAMVDVNDAASNNSEKFGIDYKVKDGVGVSLDRLLKFDRQYDIR